MEVLSISPEIDKLRETFLRMIFEGGEGYFCIAYNNKARTKFREEFFKFPQEVPQALDLVNRVYQGNNVWFSPMLMNKRRRQKEDVVFTPCAWSDLDDCPPENLHVKPTFLIQSSSARTAALWMFEHPLDPDDAEEISRRIAYKHADDGADRTGWDLTQLLRFPATYNYKYASTPIVKIATANRARYRRDDFAEHYPEIATYSFTDVPMPDVSAINGEDLLQVERLKLNPTIWRLYQEPLPEGQRSEALWKLEMLLYEAGFTREQVFAICLNAACNKFDNYGTPLAMLWKDVVRAESKYKQRQIPAQTAAADPGGPLVSEEEKAAVLRTDTFIERYIEWAKSLGDAAPQYHQAGAFTVLSALLAGAVQLPTSFGLVKPNLWFMILADTTLTRKSTAMDIAMDLVMEVDDDVLMATDGSLEGLLTSLSTRPGRPSVFLRDEFSGLLEQMTKKDYMAGMPELLTKLYDGRPQKRILRKEQIEVKDPCVLIFAGGIKDKITQLLTFEQVSSGFMPRFIFITAESDITKVKPLGPPTDWTDTNRAAIVDEIEDLHAFYTATETMVIKNSNITYESKKKFNAQLTPEAWHRYNVMETTMLDWGIKSERPEIMTPVYDRLAKSILKAAVLLSASRQKNNPVVVEEEDIVRAMIYGETWRLYAQEIMLAVGKSSAEKQLDNIVGLIDRKPGISRSVLMQNYHLDARTATQVLLTLEERGRITRERVGKGERLWPSIINGKVRE